MSIRFATLQDTESSRPHSLVGILPPSGGPIFVITMRSHEPGLGYEASRFHITTNGMTIMPKLRHIAIATNDPKATAEFYKRAFGFEQVGETSPSSPLASGYFLSDGTLNIAVLKFKTDQIGKGMDFTGVHHFGVLVEDADEATAQLEALGANTSGPL